jgi:hypothetical protein
MKTSLSAVILIATLIVAAALLFMALRPAHAQSRQWALPDYGRSHGYVTEPGMPKCNMTASEECRRLYGGQVRRGEPPRNYPRSRNTDCVFDYALAARRRGDPRALQAVADTQRTGTAIGTPSFQSLHQDAVRACRKRR